MGILGTCSLLVGKDFPEGSAVLQKQLSVKIVWSKVELGLTQRWLLVSLAA